MKKNEGKDISAGCLFSGMGGFCMGFKKAGINVIWANDVDEYAAMTFKYNFPSVYLYEQDIKTLSVKENALEPVDILAAGFPCQSFSQAGNRKGFDDERGMLFFEVIRILKEFGKNRPEILLLENVPNLQYGDHGRWFHTIIREVQRAGYWFNFNSCKVLNTSEISDIPHRRERLFMVAFSTDYFPMNSFVFPEKGKSLRILSEFIDRSRPAPDGEYLSEDNRYYAMISEKIKEGSESSIYQLRKYIVREYKDICPTLTANMGAGGHNVPFIKDQWGIRRLQISECLKLQGIEDFSFEFPEDVPVPKRYMQIGNTVSVPVVAALAERMIKHIQQSS